METGSRSGYKAKWWTGGAYTGWFIMPEMELCGTVPFEKAPLFGDVIDGLSILKTSRGTHGRLWIEKWCGFSERE